METSSEKKEPEQNKKTTYLKQFWDTATIEEKKALKKKAQERRNQVFARRRQRFYNMPTYGQLLNIILSKNYPHAWQKPALCILAVTGCRVGELIKIQKRDIQFFDITEKEMTHWSSDWAKSYRMDILIKTEKNRKNPVRIIPILRNELFGQVFDAIISHWLLFKNPDAYLFSTRKGKKPLPRGSVNELIKKHVNDEWYPHIFRHFMVSNEVKASINPVVIKQKAGWTDLRPHEIYAHLDTASLADAQRKSFGDIVKPVVVEPVVEPLVQPKQSKEQNAALPPPKTIKVVKQKQVVKKTIDEVVVL